MEENRRPAFVGPGSVGAVEGLCAGAEGARGHERTDAVTTAGLAAINAAPPVTRSASRRPAPAAVGEEFTPAKLETYRAVVFLNTGLASPLTDAQRSIVRGVLPQGRRVRRHRLGDRDRRVVAVPHQRPRHARVQPHRAADRHGQGLRPRPRRQQGAPAGLGPRRPLVQPDHERPRRLARARDRRRGPVRPAAAGPDPGRDRRRHDGRAPSRLLLQGLPGRPLVLHRARQHGRGLRRDADHPPQGRDQLGRRHERPGLQRLRRHRPAQLPADEDRIAAEPAGADRLRPAAGRPDPPDRPLGLAAPAQRGHRHDARSSPTSTTRACRARSASTPPARTGSTARRSTRTSRPTSGSTSSTRRRRSPTSSSPRARSSPRPRRPPTRRTRRRRRRRGIRTSATTSSRASSSSRMRTARGWT